MKKKKYTISGDSSTGYLEDKLKTTEPIQEEVQSSGSGLNLNLMLYYDNIADSIPSSSHNGQASLILTSMNVGGTPYNVLSVADIFMHKSGSIDETISGNKTFSNDVTFNGNIISNGNSPFLRNDATSLPNADDTYDLGSSSFRWSNIYAVNFHGTSSSSYYADVAENYYVLDTTIDKNIKPGMLVSVCRLDGYEMQITNTEDDPLLYGIISDKPGYLLRTEITDKNNVYPVALKGRVKCLIKGPISKGDFITSSNEIGIGKKSESNKGIAVSLENHNDVSIKEIYVVIV